MTTEYFSLTSPPPLMPPCLPSPLLRKRSTSPAWQPMRFSESSCAGFKLQNNIKPCQMCRLVNFPLPASSANLTRRGVLTIGDP